MLDPEINFMDLSKSTSTYDLTRVAPTPPPDELLMNNK